MIIEYLLTPLNSCLLINMNNVVNVESPDENISIPGII